MPRSPTSRAGRPIGHGTRSPSTYDRKAWSRTDARVSGSPADLAARLSWRFLLLHGGRRTTTERHRTLDALVDWSYELLTPGGRQVFEMLSVFAGSFTLTAAEQLVAAIPVGQGAPDEQDVADLVLTLVDASMLVKLPGAVTQYTMLETWRSFGRDRPSVRPYADD